MPFELNANEIIGRISATRSLLRRDSINRAIAEQEGKRHEILESFYEGERYVVKEGERRETQGRGFRS